MCYIIQQKEGLYKEAAQEAAQFVREGRYQEAWEVWERIHPQEAREFISDKFTNDGKLLFKAHVIPDNNAPREDVDVWWLYNLDHAINKLPSDVWDYCIKRKHEDVWMGSERFTKFIVRTCERMKGGIWQYYYEY